MGRDKGVEFSIIVATCERPRRLAATLKACCDAVAACEGQHRILVVDNGVGRSAREVVDESTWSAAVAYLRSKPRNKAAALNCGVQAADTQWLAFTDDDCLPSADWLKRGASFLQETGVRLCGGRLVPGEPDFSLPAWLRPGRSGLTPRGPAFMEYRPLPQSGVLGPEEMLPFGANIFVHRRVFEDYGGYDQELWMRCGPAALGSEDAEFAMRVRAGGEQIGYCSEAVVVHPVRRERATVRDYVRYAYFMGMREPWFSHRGHGAPLSFLIRSTVMAAMAGGLNLLRRDPAAAVYELVAMARAVGQIRGRQRVRSQ